MAEVWPIPQYDLVMNNDQEWFLHLLHSIPEEQRAPTMLVVWHIWHAHNELTHDKPCPPIEGSRRFLVSYLNSLVMIKEFPNADVAKGKMVIEEYKGFKHLRKHQDCAQQVKQYWKPPSQGEAKLNVDGAFTSTGAGAGMVLRDAKGEVIFTACRTLGNCSNATEAELVAIEEGLKLALHWIGLPLTVEMDCAEAVKLIKECTPNNSIHAFRIVTIRELLRERESRLSKVSHEVNVVAHELAKMSRLQNKIDFWLSSFPRDVAVSIAIDCNLILI
jgi:ribonuclease HI